MNNLSAERKQACDILIKLCNDSVRGLPEGFVVRAVSKGIMSTLEVRTYNGGMLVDATRPDRENDFLINHLGYVSGFVTSVHEDAVKLLVMLCEHRKDADAALLSSIPHASMGGDPAFEYPSNVTSEAAKIAWSSDKIWKTWKDERGEHVPLRMRMGNKHVADRRRCYWNGTNCNQYVDFKHDLSELQKGEEDNNIASFNGKSLKITDETKGEVIKRFGILNKAVRRYALNEAVIGYFTNDKLNAMSGPRGVMFGKRYFLTKDVTDELISKYELVIAKPKVTLEIVIGCLNRFDSAWQEARLQFCDENPSDTFRAVVSSKDVWDTDNIDDMSTDESNKQPCFDHFFSPGGCRRGSNCKFRHSGPAPKNRGGRGNGNRGGGGWGSWVAVNAGDGQNQAGPADGGAGAGGNAGGAGGGQPRANEQQQLYAWVPYGGGKGKGGKGKGKGKGGGWRW